MKYSDEQHIKKIYENSVKLHEYIASNHIKKEDLLKNVPLQWLVTTPLYNIGEHVYNLSAEYKKAHGDTQDDTQEKIIKMIKENPQVSTADMAKELKIGIATVKRKIKKCLMFHMSEVVTVDTGRLTDRKSIILFKL